MKAFLLAAGKGTRLRPYTDQIPKCLMPIHGKTLLSIWLDLLEQHGVTEVLINTSYLAQKVREHIDMIRERYSLQIILVHEEELLGSGGTLWANRDFVEGEEAFLICYADNLTDMDLSRMICRHRKFRKEGAVLTMGLFHAPNPRACGIAVLDDAGKIVAFTEKPESPASDLANAGVYVASKELFDFFPVIAPLGVFDFGHHVLPSLAGRMFGYFISEYLKDIGTLESYHAALDQWEKRA